MRRATRSAPIVVLLLAARSSAVVVRRRTVLGGGGAALLRPQSAAAAPVADGLILGTCCDTGAGVRDVVRGALDERWRQVDTAAFYGNEADVWAAKAEFPTSKAPTSAIFHSFRLIFGRAIISRNGHEAWMLFPERARAEHSH